MAFEIDLDSVTSAQELASLLEQQFETQANASFATTSSTFGQAVVMGAHNCAISTALGGMVSDTVQDFANNVRSVAGKVESAIAQTIENIGEVMNRVQTAIQDAVQRVQKFCTWVVSQGEALLDRAKQVIQNLMNNIDMVLNYVDNAIQAIVDAVSDIMAEMTTIANNIAIRACDSLSSAVGSVGKGSGIDQHVIASDQDISSFTRNNLEGMNNLLGVKGESLSVYADAFNPNTQFNGLNASFNEIDDLIVIRNYS